MTQIIMEVLHLYLFMKIINVYVKQKAVGM